VLKRSDELSSLGRSLDEMGWKNPEWWNDDGFASVRNNLPESTVLGDVDWDRLKNIQERALLLGAGFSSPLAAMVSMAFPREIKHAFQQVSQGKASLRDVMRFARREYALTRYTWTGRTWARQVRHTIMRLFGDNEWLAEGFLREFRDILRTRSNASLRREEVLGELAELTRRKKAYESKYLDLRHRNFGAVAEEMGMLDDLRRYADEGFPGEFAPPHEADIARSFVLRSPKAHSMGRVRDFDLRTQPTVDGRGREFLLMDENGEVAAGLRYFDQGGGSIWVRPDLRRTGLLEEIIDQLKGTSEKMVVRMLHAWTRDPSTTARGGAALQRLIKRELDNMPPSAADDPSLVRAQADEAVAATKDEALNYEALVAQINKLYDELSELERISLTNKELNAFMQRMWETFNREYIAKTGYYKVAPEAWLVDWNDHRPGSAEGTFTYNQDGELIYIPPSRQVGDLADVTLSTGLPPEA